MENQLTPVAQNMGHATVAETTATYAAPTAPEAEPGFCPFGETDVPGSGCILPAGHVPANRHLVTPGDVDDDEDQ